MSKKIIIVFLILCIGGFLGFLIPKNDKMTVDINGTYISSKITLSIESLTNTYYYMDDNNYLTNFGDTSGQFKYLDDDTIVFTSGEMIGWMIIFYNNSLKLVDSAKENIYMFEKISDTIMIS